MVKQLSNTDLPHELVKTEDGIHLNLDGHGQLHMERNLPFMLVYRPVDINEMDRVVKNLVKNEASYLICSQSHFDEHQDLLQAVVKKMSDKFGAFMLMEVWSDNQQPVIHSNRAGFQLYGPSDLLPKIIEPVKEHIENMNLAGLEPSVELAASEKRCPTSLDPLIDRKVLKQLECLLLGLKIDPFYKDSLSGEVYPLLERRIYSEFSLVFKKLVFDFVSVQTSHTFTGFQSLAKRTIQTDVWDIDREIVDIDSQMSFLMLVSPVNNKTAWNEFKNNGYKKAPVFHYRMMPVDPGILKRNLYNIPIEKIEDPTLGYLFYEKRAEADKMLSMLNDRDSRDFYYGSLQLFGPVSHSLLESAKQILKDIPVDEQAPPGDMTYYNATEFAALAEKELLELKKQCPEMNTKVVIKDTISNMMVDKGILNIPENTLVNRKRAEALIQHEIGTHVLTYYNGKSQPLKLLSSGVPGYEELQEGIAVLAEYLTGGLSRRRMLTLAARVIAVNSLIDHYDFTTTFSLLVDEYGFSINDAFGITVRVYRSGGLTKDAIYLRGLVKLIDYLQEGNKLEPLLIGKIRQNYLPVVDELIARKVLSPMCLVPSYLRNPDSLNRLKNVKNIERITELINTDT